MSPNMKEKERRSEERGRKSVTTSTWKTRRKSAKRPHEMMGVMTLSNAVRVWIWKEMCVYCALSICASFMLSAYVCVCA